MSKPDMLSGEQLVQASSKAAQELPTGGLKEFQPTHSWLEKKQIQSALDQRKDLLEEDRVEKWSCLMRAEWLPEKAKAVVKQKTKSWEVFGHNSDNTDWLFPEEAVFLLELNCLECTYKDVPLSIQRSFTVLLSEENGCSLTEYRVFSHLSRLGYRVVRHLPDLTVTAYEKQIRLDRHLDHKTTYKTLPDTQDRPSENIKTDLSAQSVQTTSMDRHHIENDKIKVVPKNFMTEHTIEVIDIADSSEESSESESDSDIEVVFETAGATEVDEGVTEISDSEDEIDVVEVPIPPKQIEVATIESSESEEEDENSGSESNRSYDGNWKRNSRTQRKFLRHPTMSNWKFSAVEEFCKEESKPEAPSRNPESADTEEDSTANSSSNPICTPALNIDPSSITRQRHPFSYGRSRNSILDLMPSMANKNNKLMTVECPDSHLIPKNAMPKQQTYTFNTNSLRARFFNPARFNNRGRRNFNGSRFNNTTVFAQNTSSGVLPNPVQALSPLMQGSQLSQMFGSDINSMARGMMQIASAILLNSSPNSFTNGYTPPRPPVSRGFVSNTFNRDDHRNRYPENQFREPYRFHQNSFRNNPLNQIMPRFGAHQVHPPGNLGFTNPSITQNLLHTNERNHIPPVLRDIYVEDQGNQSSSSNSRPNFNDGRRVLPSQSSYNGFSSVLSSDPAYIKSDVPLQRRQNRLQEDGKNFISLRSFQQKPIEIVEVVNDDVVPKPQGISGRNTKKRKMRQQRIEVMKRLKKTQCTKSDPLEIVFLDSPESSYQNENTISSSVKQENNDSSQGSFKSESAHESSAKQEPSTSNSEQQFEIKTEDTFTSVKCENNVECASETLVKQEDNSGIRVTLDNNGANIRVEIKIENQSDTSSISSFPLDASIPTDSGFKSEPESSIKSESELSSDISSGIVKNEPSTSIKKETSVDNSLDTDLSSAALAETHPCEDSKDTTATSIATDISVSENTMMDIPSDLENEHFNEAINVSEISTCINQNMPDNSKNANEASISRNVTSSDENNTIDCNRQDADTCLMEIEVNDDSLQTQDSLLPLENNKQVDRRKRDSNNQSSWAEMKINNVALQLNESQDDTCGEDEDQIMPLIRNKHCKTLGTVLSKLQIFKQFSPEVPSDISKLKISYDLYLPATFRKSHRGLPHFRISVFEGSEMLPSAAQLHELQHRFSDGVSVLCAVVMPSSVVFYSYSDVSIPVDITSSPTS